MGVSRIIGAATRMMVAAIVLGLEDDVGVVIGGRLRRVVGARGEAGRGGQDGGKDRQSGRAVQGPHVSPMLIGSKTDAKNYSINSMNPAPGGVEGLVDCQKPRR